MEKRVFLGLSRGNSPSKNGCRVLKYTHAHKYCINTGGGDWICWCCLFFSWLQPISTSYSQSWLLYQHFNYHPSSKMRILFPTQKYTFMWKMIWFSPAVTSLSQIGWDLTGENSTAYIPAIPEVTDLLSPLTWPINCVCGRVQVPLRNKLKLPEEFIFTNQRREKMLMFTKIMRKNWQVSLFGVFCFLFIF